MEFTFGLEMPFCTFFKKIQESSPICMHLRGATNECVNMYYEMHMTGDSQKIKARKEYVLSTKTGQSGLANWNIQFSQHNQKNCYIWFGKSDYLIFSERSY
jgi:hypothetical protein